MPKKTEEELYDDYLEEGYDEYMDFHEYVRSLGTPRVEKIRKPVEKYRKDGGDE